MSSVLRRFACAATSVSALTPAIAVAAVAPHPTASHGHGMVTGIVIAVGTVLAIGLGFWFFNWTSKKMMRDMSEEAKRRLKAAGIDEPTEADKELVAALKGEGPAATAWQKRMAAAVSASRKSREFFWFPDEPGARALVGELLTEVASLLGSGQVKQKPDDKTLELRGLSGGAPFRVVVDGFGGVGDLEMQCDNRVGPFVIHRDMDKVPQPVEADDPWDKLDVHRVFLAKGVFVEGHDEVDAQLAAWGRVPADAQAAILAEMNGLEPSRIGATAAGVSVAALGPLEYATDPASEIVSAVQLLGMLKNGVAIGDYSPGTGLPAGALTPSASRLTCKFCRSIFLLAVGKNACPNCGANATA